MRNTLVAKDVAALEGKEGARVGVDVVTIATCIQFARFKDRLDQWNMEPEFTPDP